MASPWVYNKTAQQLSVVLHYSYAIILLVFFLFVVTLRSILTSEKPKNEDLKVEETGPGGKPLPKTPVKPSKISESNLDFSRPRKLLFDWLSVFISCTFIANATSVIIHAIVKRGQSWWCGKDVVVYIVAAFFIYLLILISLVDTTPAPTSAHFATWLVALVMELMLFASALAVTGSKHREPKYGAPSGGKLRYKMTRWEIADSIIGSARILLLLALIVFYAVFVCIRRNESKAAKKRAAIIDEASSETTGLLSGHGTANGSTNGPTQVNGYGSAATGGKHKHTEGAPAGWERPTTMPARSWWEYLRGYSFLMPYLWPSKDFTLKIVFVICIALVIAQRVLNLLVPTQIGKITDILAGENGPVRTPWIEICVLIAFKFLQGGNGLLGAARSNLWIPISQYSYREISVASFEHVHSLSLDFHLGKKTGEVLSALGKGSSINTFLEQVTFQMIPMMVDLIIAIGYFLILFDAYYALVVAVVTFWYIYITIRLAQWRADIRRVMVNADREEDAVKNDSMVSYETVKYFNAEAYEFNRYREAVEKYQKAEYKVMFSLNIMNVAQNFVFMLGLMVTCFIAAYQVSLGILKVGKFVVLLTYMAQLQAPLNFFGTFYRMVQAALISSERMLELFKEKPTVTDSETAIPLPACEGGIKFTNVNFRYDARKSALEGLTFECKPGSTTALVGESGGGKSTVFRLLFRFYNAQSGSIQIDGHDVQDRTIDSVRRHIGVVPQDTVLFNETIMYNLKYANQEASNENVYDACRAASIHEKILSFPDGYSTKVGERGLRLSGGEKQRVAIARTILKNPRIIMLDEATAALDSETEEHIQEALTTLSQGRTMLVIAHRLSTITLADQILVLSEGKVAECGTHHELLALKGRYASMWRKQIRAEKAAEQARTLKDRADRLRAELRAGTGVDSADQTDDEHQG